MAPDKTMLKHDFSQQVRCAKLCFCVFLFVVVVFLVVHTVISVSDERQSLDETFNVLLANRSRKQQ
jgi:hypothetical protein